MEEDSRGYVAAGSTDLNQLVLGKAQFNKRAATRWTTNGALRPPPSCDTDDLRLQANIPPTYHCGRHEEIPGQEGSQTHNEEDDPYCVVPGEEGQGETCTCSISALSFSWTSVMLGGTETVLSLVPRSI